MSRDSFIQHTKDFAVSVMGAMATAGIVAGLQYLGAHIPNLTKTCADVAGAFSALKISKYNA